MYFNKSKVMLMLNIVSSDLKKQGAKPLVFAVFHDLCFKCKLFLMSQSQQALTDKTNATFR